MKTGHHQRLSSLRTIICSILFLLGNGGYSQGLGFTSVSTAAGVLAAAATASHAAGTLSSLDVDGARAKGKSTAAAMSGENRTLLVSTLDGQLHALSLQGGNRIWSLKSSPLISSDLDHSLEEGGDQLVDSIIAGIDGSLYYAGEKGLKNAGVNIKEIARNSPLKSRGTRYISTTTSRVLLVSKTSGKVVRMLDTQTAAMGECAENDELDGDEIVWVHKTELNVHAIDSSSGKRRWNISFGEFLPFYDSEEHESVSTVHRSTMRAESRTSITNSAEEKKDTVQKRMPFVGVTVTGNLYCEYETKNWSLALGSPVSAVHLIDNSNDIRKVPHVYLEHHFFRESAKLSGTNLAGNDGGSEIVYVGKNDDGQYFAISSPSLPTNNNFTFPKIDATEVVPFLDPVRDERALALLDDEKVQSIKLPTYDVGPQPARLPGLESEVGIDTNSLKPEPLNRHLSSRLDESPMCLPGEEAYPECLSGFHYVAVDAKPIISMADMDRFNYMLPMPSRYRIQREPDGTIGIQVVEKSIWGLGGLWLGLGLALGLTVKQVQLLLMSSTTIFLGLLYWSVREFVARYYKPKKRTKTVSMQTTVKDQERVIEANVGKKGKKRHHHRLGKMRLFTKQVLGRGSSGTIVFRGLWDKREVAIKRLLKDACEQKEETKNELSVDKEIDLLISSDHLPNIVRYYAKEEDDTFMYLALERCKSTLFHFVVNSSNYTPALALETVRGVVAGVVQLHSLNVVHRDLKPRNILLSSDDQAKIADMGLGKKLSKHRSSFDSRVCGSVGWQPSEMIELKTHEPESDLNICGGAEIKELSRNDSTGLAEKKDDGFKATCNKNRKGILETCLEQDKKNKPRLTKAVDVFSAGCIIYYTLTKGKHPFGSEPEREYNILHNKVDLSDLDNNPLAKDLVKSMICKNAEDRITAVDAQNHPLFWNAQKRLNFLQDVSDRVVKSDSFHLCSLMESEQEKIVGKQWQLRIDSQILTDAGKYRKYNFNSVCDCLRLIRNKRHHYLELPAGAKKNLGNLPTGFVGYFEKIFPLLLLHSYKTIGSFYAYKSGLSSQLQNPISKSFPKGKPDDYKKCVYVGEPTKIKLKAKKIDFETFSGYYGGLSKKRTHRFLQEVTLKNKPSRSWWLREDIWIM